MCDLCDDSGGEMESCQSCGCLICFDDDGDDVIRPAYVTTSGDLFCSRCGRKHDQAEEEDEEDEEEDDYEDDDY